MSEYLWYYELLNETHGPVSTDEIQQMVAEGQLSAGNRIRPESSEEWITVTDLKTLVEKVADGEDEWEEVTDLDDLNFTFEDSSAGVNRASESSGDLDARHSELSIDSFELKGDPEEARHSELDIDSFQLSGDPESARHSAFDSVAGQSSGTQWMVQSLGQVLGPMAMTELIGMAEAGALASSDEIREENQLDWVSADSIPEVAFALARGAAGKDKAASMTATAGKRRKSSTGTQTSSGEGDTAKGKSKPSSKSVSGRKSNSSTGRKRRRKKKRSKKDQLLAEIFSDVFAEDGKVRDVSERPDLAKPTAQAGSIQAPANLAPANPVAPVVPGFDAPGQNITPASGAMPSSGMASPAGMSGYPGSSPGSSPGMPSGAAARPAFAPPPRKKKRSGGGGGGSSLPAPPVLAGIAGGLLVLIVGLGAYLEWFTLPGFGLTPESLFAEFDEEFPALMAQPVIPTEWVAFRAEFFRKARAVAETQKATAGTDPTAEIILKRALLIVRMVELSQLATDARKALWDEYVKLKPPPSAG